MVIDEDVLLQVARGATARPDGRLGRWEVVPSPHRVANMTTHSLDRVSGTLDDGTPWSAFVKALHPASESPIWQLIPDEHHAQVLHELNWLDEPTVYRSGLAARCPEGLRLPAVFHIDEQPSRITLWLEDVDDVGPWDLERHHRAAAALGRLGGAWPEQRACAELGMGRRPLHGLFFGKIVHNDLPALADDRLWEDPAIAPVVDDRHRADLARLADVVPGLLQRMDRLPHGMSHGDATPDNLREPGDGTVVAIDWSYGSCCALGSDLGQLLAGRIESGAADPSELPEVAAANLDGYVTGLADVGCPVDIDAVELAWATHLAVRSVFSALLVDDRPDLSATARQELLAGRARLARFGLDLVQRVVEKA